MTLYVRVVFRGPFKSLEREFQPGLEIELPEYGPKVWKIQMVERPLEMEVAA